MGFINQQTSLGGTTLYGLMTILPKKWLSVFHHPNHPMAMAAGQWWRDTMRKILRRTLGQCLGLSMGMTNWVTKQRPLGIRMISRNDSPRRQTRVAIRASSFFGDVGEVGFLLKKREEPLVRCPPRTNHLTEFSPLKLWSWNLSPTVSPCKLDFQVEVVEFYDVWNVTRLFLPLQRQVCELAKIFQVQQG